MMQGAHVVIRIRVVRSRRPARLIALLKVICYHRNNDAFALHFVGTSQFEAALIIGNTSTRVVNISMVMVTNYIQW